MYIHLNDTSSPTANTKVFLISRTDTERLERPLAMKTTLSWALLHELKRKNTKLKFRKISVLAIAIAI